MMIGIRFFVNGEATSDEELLVVIPSRYKMLFRSHNFKDMHDLSMALMYASCAAESRWHHKPWMVKENENALFSILEK